MPFIPEPIRAEKPKSAEVDERKSIVIYRKVAGLKDSDLLQQDAEGDTVLHLAIVKDEFILVEALLKRLEREGLTSRVINIQNMQHQTPLCLAVMSNSPANVRRLVEAGADVNFQVHRNLSNNMGPKYYSIIHFVASRGLAWSDTLDELLKAKNLDLNALNSEGLSCLHCAIDSHGRLGSSDCQVIDSRRTIYKLLCRGANLALQDGLSGKTPLHCVVEKKNLDFLSWFLDLVRYVSETSPALSGSTNAGGAETNGTFLQQIINARTGTGASALNIAVALQMDPAQRTNIVRLLIRHGARLTRNDSALRKELMKIPDVAAMLKSVSGSTRSHSISQQQQL